MGEPVQVELEPLAERHTECILRWRSDPVVARELFSVRAPTREEHLAWLKTLGERRREFVILAGPERRPVGTIGLSQIDPHHGHAEYGVLLGEEGRGRGYAGAASQLLLARAFGDLRLHRVYLRVFADNAAALRLYERLGFRCEGVLREHGRGPGGYRDVVMMGLLEAEWRARTSRS